MSPKATGFSLAAIVLVVLAAHLTLVPKVADLDGFYHLGHAAAYAEGSLFDTSFPWHTQSVIGARGADIWWGFHVLLMPFSLFDDPADGIRVAALVITLVFALGLFWILRRHGVVEAGAWSAICLIAVPNVLYRFLSVRPHIVSGLAALLLVSVLARGRWWQAGLIAAFITWVHLGVFWLAPGVVCAYALVRLTGTALGEARPEDDLGVPVAPAVSAVFLGTVAGWLLRPHPVDAGVIANVQIVRLFAEKATQEPLLFASELLPLGPTELAGMAWGFLAVWVGGLAWGAHRLVRRRLGGMRAEERTLVLTCTLVSAVFLVLTLFAARRALVEWVTFGFLALALLWTHGTSPEDRRAVRALLATLLLFHLGWAARRHTLNVDLVAFPGDTLAEAAAFLEENSEPGDVVFHAHWDNFGPLFAHNRTNRYLGGMDPIFQFAHDPSAYWEYFYLSTDVNVEWTCDAFPCATGVATDTHTVMRDHFGARWVLVEPARNPRLTLHLLDSPDFRLALETQREAVFEVLAPSDPDRPVGAGEPEELDGSVEPDSVAGSRPVGSGSGGGPGGADGGATGVATEVGGGVGGVSDGGTRPVGASVGGADPHDPVGVRVGGRPHGLVGGGPDGAVGGARG